MAYRALTVAVLAGVLTLGSAGAVSALEFVAERTTQIDGRTHKARIYYRDQMWRVEHNEAGPVHITIVRKDKGVAWLLDARFQQFMTETYHAGHDPFVSERLPGEIAREEIASEMLQGHPTRVSRITIQTAAGEKLVFYQWFATDIRFPLRTVQKDVDWIIEYTNVKLTRLGDYMFALPRMYQPAPARGHR